MDQETWLKRNTASLAGKTAVLTGATGGLGGPISRALLSCGADLILVGRDPERTEALRTALLREYPEGQIRCLWADLSDFSQVRQLAGLLQQLPVDLLIHNAGAYSIPRKTCTTGYDNVFQINFISPYYLTKELLPLLHRRHGKVVAVGSIAHNYSKTDPEDLDFSSRTAASLVYGNSKRFLMFALMGLLRESGVAFAIGHPGITFTNITAHYPKLIFAVIKHPMKVIFMKPSAAARSIIRAIFEDVPDQHWVGPALFNVWGSPRTQKLSTCSREEQERICAAAEKIYAGLLRSRG